MVHSLNEKQCSILDDIMCKKQINPNESLFIFKTSGARIRKKPIHE
jgi:hypothetical protein